MYAFAIATATFAALAQAVPHAHNHRHAHAHAAEKRDAQNFELTIHNNCADTKTFGLYQVTAAFDMLSMSSPIALESNHSTTIQAPFNELGMRLSATADQEDQWVAQTLFEFGYSTYNDLTGTAYDLSVMEGAAEGEGIAAYPATSECESKICTATGCGLAESWTNADQTANGSPADTVCYQGMQNFKVVWCPN